MTREAMTVELPPLRSVDDLVAAIQAGLRPKYLYFWGHTGLPGIVGKECLSQWYPSAFTTQGTTYTTAEHYMMAEKARLFGDEETRGRILRARTPGEAKALGRVVRGFDQAVWDAHRSEIVYRGNLAKFSQNHPLMSFLVGTRQRVLVEASPRDLVWGIGLDHHDPRAREPSTWAGLNLLGFALMRARGRLLRDGAPAANRGG